MMELPTFQNAALLRQALTSPTYANEHPEEGFHYQQLEFLGDSIVEFVVRDLMLEYYPSMNVGEMSQRCDRLVTKSAFASLAVQLSIPDLMRLGRGSQAERTNPKMQADMFEAVIGAYRLDAGVVAAYSYVESIFRPLVERELELPLVDPVSELNEYAQSELGGITPDYRVVEASGPDHNKVFILEVWIGNVSYGRGQGKSKSEARKQAAISALRRINQ
jgi:ribonuclease-3